jgi:hypothetical protein
MSNDESFDIESFNISVSFKVIKKTHDNFDGFFWPSTLDETPFFSLSVSTDGSIIFSVSNTSFVGKDVFKILSSLVQFHSSNRSGDFIGIFVVDSKVTSGGFTGSFRVFGFSRKCSGH